MIAAFRFTFFIVIGTRALPTKTSPRRSRKTGRRADAFARRCRAVAISARKCSRLLFGVITMMPKRMRHSRESWRKSFARVKIVARSGWRGALAVTKFSHERLRTSRQRDPVFGSTSYRAARPRGVVRSRRPQSVSFSPVVFELGRRHAERFFAMPDL